MTFVDPNQFIITRKRKKYKFALFANSPLCFEVSEWHQRAADMVEIGAGTGLFSVELAEKMPDKTFVALDVKADRLQKGARQAEARGLENILFVRARADQISELFTPHRVQQIWITFPDPFPKKRSAGRRLTHSHFLQQYQTTLRAGGAINLKHDDVPFFQWSLEQLVAKRWRLEELSFDLHDSDLPEMYKTLTTYETRWLAEGKKINFVVATAPEEKK